jgi:hypothetical protein
MSEREYEYCKVSSGLGKPPPPSSSSSGLGMLQGLAGRKQGIYLFETFEIFALSIFNEMFFIYALLSLKIDKTKMSKTAFFF